jgi:hypothetical protein
MSEADDLNQPFALQGIPAQQRQLQQARSSEGDAVQLENSLRTQLETTINFPVRWEPPKSLLSSTSGRVKLSIVRSRLEKTWDVKEINTQLREDDEKTLYWLIRPKQALEQPKIRKDDDDLSLEDLLMPFGKGGMKF